LPSRRQKLGARRGAKAAETSQLIFSWRTSLFSGLGCTA
jgi:hypothetical protein